MNFRDVELLSAYLDGQLSPSDSARLEARLKSDAELRGVMDDLRASRGLLRALPQRRASRNFTLTPKMAGIKPPEPRAYPAFRLATVLAALLFVASVALNGLAPVASSQMARSAAPAYGYGGGGPCNNCGASTGLTEAPAAAPAPASTEASLQALPPQPFAAAPATTRSMATETPLATIRSLATQDNGSNLAASTAETAPQSVPPASLPSLGQVPNPSAANKTASEASRAPVPLGWEIGLGALALVFGLAAGSVRLNSERKFRARFLASINSTRTKGSPKK